MPIGCYKLLFVEYKIATHCGLRAVQRIGAGKLVSKSYAAIFAERERLSCMKLYFLPAASLKAW